MGRIISALDWPLIMLVALAVWIGPRRGKSPLHSAFTFSFFGLVFFLTGVLGYNIRGVQGLQSAAGVVWSQVRLAIVCAVAAVVFWRRTLQTF